MTHPLTPREKVAAFLKERDEACGVIDADDDERDESAGLILTALASGSVDHAELAKRLRASKRDRHGIYGRVLVNPDGPTAADALEAILAENAALRAMAEKVSDGSMEQTDKLLAMHDRATEAERKLAEAVESIQRLEWSCEQLAATRSQTAYDQMISDGQAQALLELDNARKAVRTFLSKEAERG